MQSSYTLREISYNLDFFSDCSFSQVIHLNSLFTTFVSHLVFFFFWKLLLTTHNFIFFSKSTTICPSRPPSLTPSFSLHPIWDAYALRHLSSHALFLSFYLRLESPPAHLLCTLLHNKYLHYFFIHLDLEKTA